MEGALRRLSVALIALALAAAAAAAAAGFALRFAVRLPPALASVGGPLVLETANGRLALSDLRGAIVLLYFGYAHCPDACPAALQTIAAVLDRLPASVRAHGLFVSVDPVRDKPQMLARYARFYHPEILAGTMADIARLRKAAARFRVDFHYETPDGRPDPGRDYAVEHTSFIYLLNPRGRVVNLYDFREDPARIAAEAVRWWVHARIGKWRGSVLDAAEAVRWWVHARMQGGKE